MVVSILFCIVECPCLKELKTFYPKRVDLKRFVNSKYFSVKTDYVHILLKKSCTLLFTKMCSDLLEKTERIKVFATFGVFFLNTGVPIRSKTRATNTREHAEN